MAKDANHRHSFILRIWRTGENQEWKQWVKHADSGESTSLHTLFDLLPFIEQHIEESDTPSTETPVQPGHNGKSGLK